MSLRFSYSVTEQVTRDSLVHSFFIFRLARYGVFVLLGLLFYVLSEIGMIALEKDYALYIVAFNVILLLMGKRIATQQSANPSLLQWHFQEELLVHHSEGEEVKMDYRNIHWAKWFEPGVLFNTEKVGKVWMSTRGLSEEEKEQLIALLKDKSLLKSMS